MVVVLRSEGALGGPVDEIVSVNLCSRMHRPSCKLQVSHAESATSGKTHSLYETRRGSAGRRGQLQ